MPSPSRATLVDSVAADVAADVGIVVAAAAVVQSEKFLEESRR